MSRDLRRLVDTALDRGWTVSRTPGGHLRLRHPNGALIYTGTTPSDWRAQRNVEADMRRAERRAEDRDQ